jgi:hypothetical protein
MAELSFLEKLAKQPKFEWTPEPAPSAAESLRKDRAYGVDTMAKLEAVILARRAEAENAKKNTKA